MNAISIPLEQRTRISKKLLKNLDPNVAKGFLAIQTRYPTIKSFFYYQKQEGYQFVVGEGERYTFVYGAKLASVDVVSNDTVGAAGVSHAIGSTLEPPEGTVIFKVVLCYGKWYLTVTNIIAKGPCCTKCNDPINVEVDTMYLNYTTMPLMCNQCVLRWTCSDCGAPLGYEGSGGDLCSDCEAEDINRIREDEAEDWAEEE